jgi:nucleotide-binding universal stress UspA family protein
MVTSGKRPIVVGVDGSSSAEEATRWAAGEARRRRVPLSLLHAYPWAERIRRTGRPEPEARGEELFRRQARECLERAEVLARETAPDVEITTEMVDGRPIELLTARAPEAEMIVLGSRGLGGVSGLLLGSVAVGLVSHAPCPVVIIRGEIAAEGAPVVVGIDDSSHNEAVLAFGYDHAALHGAPLVVVRAWADAVVDPATALFLDGDAICEEERRDVAEQLAGWREKYPDVAVTVHVTLDRPGHALLEVSKGARTVVVGARGRGGMAGLLLGSTSQALIHRAPCPVTVVHNQ